MLKLKKLYTAGIITAIAVMMANAGAVIQVNESEVSFLTEDHFANGVTISGKNAG